MRAHYATSVEVRREAAEAFNREVDSRHEGTVWTSGCSSWYLDDTGRNATLWPDWTFRFRRETSRFNPAHYRLEREGAQAGARPQRGRGHHRLRRARSGLGGPGCG